MAKSKLPTSSSIPGGTAAEVSIRIGSRATFDASITTAGLLSIAALVSGAILSSALIVVAAGRNRTKQRPLELNPTRDN